MLDFYNSVVEKVITVTRLFLTASIVVTEGFNIYAKMFLHILH